MSSLLFCRLAELLSSTATKAMKKMLATPVPNSFVILLFPLRALSLSLSPVNVDLFRTPSVVLTPTVSLQTLFLFASALSQCFSLASQALFLSYRFSHEAISPIRRFSSEDPFPYFFPSSRALSLSPRASSSHFLSRSPASFPFFPHFFSFAPFLSLSLQSFR